MSISSWNSVQHYVTTLMGEEFEKKIDICVCITESLCCTFETNTTLLTNYTPKYNKQLKSVMPQNVPNI